MTGIICINKQKDITSFGVVAKVRGITKEKKAGHTGTLDPMATGVLPVMLWGATRFLNYIADSDKGYRATFSLGITTDTLDITGNILSQSSVDASPQDVENVLEKFRGNIMQTPPMFSAKSVDGVRLYDLARQGVEVERKPCPVEIKRLELIEASADDNRYVIDVLCSKGTYIRSLIDDIGKALGCGAVMTALERTMAMGFTLGDCVTIEQLQARKDDGVGFDDIVIDAEEILSNYQAIAVSQAQSTRFSNGGALDINRIKAKICKDTLYRVYSHDGVFLGLGMATDQEIRVEKLLTKRD